VHTLGRHIGPGPRLSVEIEEKNIGVTFGQLSAGLVPFRSRPDDAKARTRLKDVRQQLTVERMFTEHKYPDVPLLARTDFGAWTPVRAISHWARRGCRQPAMSSVPQKGLTAALIHAELDKKWSVTALM
jgi:hypothetical protein